MALQLGVMRQLSSCLLISPLSLADGVQQSATCTLHKLLFAFPSPTFCFQFINPLPFQHPSRHTLVKGYVHFRTFSVCSQGDACGLMPSPHPPCMLHTIEAQTEQGFPVAGGLFKKHSFSHLIYFFTQLLSIIITAPILLKVLKATVCATIT